MLAKVDIVNRALECQGRPWQEHGRMPGRIDCMGMVIHAGGELVPPEAALIPYARLPEQGFVIQMLAKYADPVPFFLRDGLELADIVLIPQAGRSIHVGIIIALTPAPTALHVGLREGCCDMFVDPKRLTGVFRFRGLSD
jgi:hypothetical protein